MEEETLLIMSNREQQEDQKPAAGKAIKKKNHHKHKSKKASASAAEESASSSSASSPPPSCSCGKAAEYGCSCCLCCVYCPLSVVWCCVKLPCKVGIRAAQAAKRQLTNGGGSGSWSCGRKKPSYYYSSSFSDLEFSPP